MNASSEDVANLTLQEYLESHLGVQTLPLQIVVPITALFVLISITGIVGNVVVCMVIAKHPNMHTATNYYLFSLAVADVTILVFGEIPLFFLFSTALFTFPAFESQKDLLAFSYHMRILCFSAEL